MITKQLLDEAINRWPEFDTGEEVSGADLVDWFAAWRQNVMTVLQDPDTYTPRVIVGMEGGLYQGFSSNMPANVDIIDHDIRKDLDPLPADIMAYCALCEELDALPYCEGGELKPYHEKPTAVDKLGQIKARAAR